LNIKIFTWPTVGGEGGHRMVYMFVNVGL